MICTFFQRRDIKMNKVFTLNIKDQGKSQNCYLIKKNKLVVGDNPSNKYITNKK